MAMEVVVALQRKQDVPPLQTLSSTSLSRSHLCLNMSQKRPATNISDIICYMSLYHMSICTNKEVFLPQEEIHKIAPAAAALLLALRDGAPTPRVFGYGEAGDDPEGASQLPR